MVNDTISISTQTINNINHEINQPLRCLYVNFRHNNDLPFHSYTFDKVFLWKFYHIYSIPSLRDI